MGVAKKAIDSEYQPTKAEMEQDVSILGTLVGVVRALFANDPPVVEVGQGREVKEEI